MRSYFICLANSKKWNNRCIGGILINIKKGNKFTIEKRFIGNYEVPKWIRPVSRSEHGEIPEYEVKGIIPMDIVEIELLSPCPSGYQSENCYYQKKTIRKVGVLEKKKENLERIKDHAENFIYLNNSNRISENEIKQVKSSLVLVKPSDINFFMQQGMNLQPQLRCSFTYHENCYNLPVTDLAFEAIYYVNNQIIRSDDFYFCISLGTLFNGYHYKLIAGIIYT